MTRDDIQVFINQLNAKNSWGKNEIVDLFTSWVLDVLLKEIGEKR